MLDQIHTIAPLTMAALCAVASVMFAGAAAALFVADKRAQRARKATVARTNEAWATVWANARANRIKRAAGRMVAHGQAARESYGDAAGMVADTLGDAFEYVEARTLDSVYRAHVRIETAAGRMVSHSFDVRADDAREAREWAWFALYESGASGRSHVTMIRRDGRIVA
jgi:gas vesicle protein